MELFIGSLVRHLLTLLAGGLITVGVSENDSATFLQSAVPIVSGLMLYGEAQAWSLDCIAPGAFVDPLKRNCNHPRK